MSSKKFIDDYDKINYHLNGLLELIGYKIERLYFVGESIETVTIKNLFTNASYIGDPSKFDYADFILEFLKMLVERDLAGVEPEKYGNLVVRVAGYSAFFSELNKKIQDDIIHRTEHGL